MPLIYIMLSQNIISIQLLFMYQPTPGNVQTFPDAVSKQPRGVSIIITPSRPHLNNGTSAHQLLKSETWESFSTPLFPSCPYLLMRFVYSAPIIFTLPLLSIYIVNPKGKSTTIFVQLDNVLSLLIYLPASSLLPSIFSPLSSLKASVTPHLKPLNGFPCHLRSNLIP